MVGSSEEAARPDRGAVDSARSPCNAPMVPNLPIGPIASKTALAQTPLVCCAIEVPDSVPDEPPVRTIPWLDSTATSNAACHYVVRSRTIDPTRREDTQVVAVVAPLAGPR